jgi:amino acid transporter
MKVADTLTPTRANKRLAELGYKQELHRSWSGFSNFAISFSIISILAGCFTTFGAGWNNGGRSRSRGLADRLAFILVIGCACPSWCRRIPTSGGIYWWAAKLGGRRPATTRLAELIGLLAIDGLGGLRLRDVP